MIKFRPRESQKINPQSLNFDHIHGLSLHFPPLPGAWPGAHLSLSPGMLSSLPIPLNIDAHNIPNDYKGTLNKSTPCRWVPTTNHISRRGMPTTPNSYSHSQNSNVVSNANLILLGKPCFHRTLLLPLLCLVGPCLGLLHRLNNILEVSNLSTNCDSGCRWNYRCIICPRHFRYVMLGAAIFNRVLPSWICALRKARWPI